jgi:hypothetical protein
MTKGRLDEMDRRAPIQGMTGVSMSEPIGTNAPRDPRPGTTRTLSAICGQALRFGFDAQFKEASGVNLMSCRTRFIRHLQNGREGREQHQSQQKCCTAMPT